MKWSEMKVEINKFAGSSVNYKVAGLVSGRHRAPRQVAHPEKETQRGATGGGLLLLAVL